MSVSIKLGLLQTAVYIGVTLVLDVVKWPNDFMRVVALTMLLNALLVTVYYWAKTFHAFMEERP